MDRTEKKLLLDDINLFGTFMFELAASRLLFEESMRLGETWLAGFYAETMRIYTVHSVHIYRRIERELGCS